MNYQNFLQSVYNKKYFTLHINSPCISCKNKKPIHVVSFSMCDYEFGLKCPKCGEYINLYKWLAMNNFDPLARLEIVTIFIYYVLSIHDESNGVPVKKWYEYLGEIRDIVVDQCKENTFLYDLIFCKYDMYTFGYMCKFEREESGREIHRTWYVNNRQNPGEIIEIIYDLFCEGYDIFYQPDGVEDDPESISSEDDSESISSEDF